jgi:hypothetical protein
VYAKWVNRALQECELKRLQERRDDLCVRLIKQTREPSHKLHSLLPRKCSEVKGGETRTNPDKFYNFFCRTERFKRNPLVYAINRYNDSLKLYFLIENVNMMQIRNFVVRWADCVWNIRVVLLAIILT